MMYYPFYILLDFSESLGKIELKPQWAIHYSPLKWLPQKRQMTTIVGEDVEKLDPSYIVSVYVINVVRPLWKTAWQFLQMLTIDYLKTQKFHCSVYTHEK